MGAGLLALTGSMVVAALVEGARRKGALQVPEVKMSALWLVPQYWLARIAEALRVPRDEAYCAAGDSGAGKPQNCLNLPIV
ncbi:hypothetical protein AMTR_s00109p00102860 [Amborella trichopoda]|uniref:Uncharacterized protein n=1 Tax=Amborella trichopoda TaxID=13333 RepID=W1NPK6_AMBTC|nr:hypothetical protein AMTR_s00109p00102860 [Amborella trichopoda]